MTVNEAGWDRVLRVVAGLLMLYLGIGGAVTGALAIVVDVIGVLLLLTGAVGYCPAYPLLGFKTRKA